MTFGTDLTLMAAEGMLDPVIGREKQIEQVAEILCKRHRNSACLIGDSGVGKAAIVRGLALSMTKSTFPPDLRKRIILFDMRTLTGCQDRRELEHKFTKIVDEVKKSNAILFLEELHTFVGAVAYMLKPQLARGELKCIGATTPEGYKFIEKDPALKRLFQVVQVPEPHVDETAQILRGLKRKYEDSHQVTYLDDALIASSKLSKRYIGDEFLPFKAIDVVDTAGAKMKLRGGNVVTSAVIEEVISSRAGIPAEKISGKGSARLLQLEKIFQEQIIGQDEAVDAVARAIRRSSVGFGDPDRPVSLLFIGPTGVGKTEVAKLLALEYFGSKDSMIRLDMSEYKEKHSVSRLFGSPPGYIGCNDGGQLTEAIRKRPHCLILLDEVEKGHPDIFDAFLQVLDDGRLTDGKGRVVHFKDAIIIMTSNIGFSHGQVEAKLEDVNAHLERSFRPEFLNRVDEKVIFKRLGEREMMKIMEVMLKQFCQRIQASKGISLEIMDGFKKMLISEMGGRGKNDYGARPLKRAITKNLVDKLAENWLRGNIKEGDSLLVNVDSKGDARFLCKDGWYLDDALEPEDWDVVSPSPVDSNFSLDQSASWAVSEEPESAADHACHSNERADLGLIQSVSLRNHQVKLHELNSLEWDELLVNDDPTKANRSSTTYL